MPQKETFRTKTQCLGSEPLLAGSCLTDTSVSHMPATAPIPQMDSLGLLSYLKEPSGLSRMEGKKREGKRKSAIG